MADPFKKYALEIAEDQKRRELDPLMKLKKSILGAGDVPDFAPAVDYREFANTQEFESAGGRLTASALDHFNRQNAARDQANFDQHTEERRLREQNAWVSDAGLETLTGKGINAVAAAGKTVNRIAANAATTPDTAAVEGMLEGIPENVLELWAIKNAGKRELTDQENALLDSKEQAENSSYVTKGMRDRINPLGDAETAVNTLSFRDRLSKANQYLERANNISDAFENSGINANHNPINSQKLLADLGNTYERHAFHFTEASKAVDEGNYGNAVINTMMGIGNLLKDGGGDLLNNPAATFEFIVEQSPYLAIGSYSKKVLGAVNAAYAGDIYRQKLEAYEKEHGRPPSKDDRTSMAIWSGTAAIAEQVGDLSMLKALQGRAGFSKAVTKVLEVTPDAVQKVAKNTLTKNLLAVGKTAATEGMTEIYQTAVEESKDNPFDGTVEGKALFTAGILGAAAGGGFASVGSTGNVISSVTGSVAKTLDDRAKDQAPTRVNKELVNQYVKEIQAGERKIDSLLDSSDPRTYDPARAAGLHILKAIDTKSSPEQRTEAKQKANDILDMLSQRVIDQRAELAAETNKVERKKISKSLRETQEFLRRTTDGHAQLARIEEFQNSDTQEQDLKTATQEEVTEESQAATERVIRTMSMNTDLYGEESLMTDLQRLKESPSITEAQREYINGVEASFTAQQALNNINKKPEQVARSILTGAVGFKGIREYRRDVNRALKNGDAPRATTEVDNLRRFAQEHTSKLNAARIAREQAVNGGKNTFIYKDPNSDTGWKHEVYNPSKGYPWNNAREQSQLGGFAFVRQKKGGFTGADHITNLETEVALINAMGIELSQAVNLAQGSEVIARTPAGTAGTNSTFGFDSSVVPEVSQSAPAGSGNIDVGEETATAPEPAQQPAEAAPVDVRTQAIETAQRIGMPDAEGFVDALIQQETSPDENIRNTASDRINGFVREARSQGITFSQLGEVSSLMEQLDQTESNQQETSGDNLTEQGAISDQAERTQNQPAQETQSETQAEQSDPVQEERRDVAGLARLFRIENDTGNPTGTGTIDQVLAAQAKIIELVMSNKITKAGLAAALDWLHTVDIEADPLRMERATYKKTDHKTGERLSDEQIAKNKAKFERRSKGNTRQYIARQLIEELGELVLEKLIADGRNTTELETLLEAQKRVLKSDRFGEDTVIKDDASPYNGQTNREAAVAATEQVGIQNAADKDSDTLIQELNAKVITTLNPEADTTTQAQAAPAAQEPDVVVSAQTEQNQEQELLAEDSEASELFQQRKAGRNTLTTNPLANKTSFFSELFQSGENFVTTMQQYLEKPITEKQSILLNHFAGFAKRVDTVLQDITGPERHERFEHEDLVKTFGETVPDNLRAGIIASIYSVVGEDGWKTRNLDSDINAILNRDLNTTPSADERRVLGKDPIVRHNVFARKLGKRVIQYLNIQALRDQPVDKIRNLEAALGAYAVGLMTEQGLLLKQESNDPVLNQDNPREQVTHNLVMINVHDPLVKEIVEKTRGTSSVLTRLFGTEEMSSEPASKPGSFVAAKQNSDLAQLEQSQNTGLTQTGDNIPVLKKNIPAVLAKTLEIVSRRPQKLNQEVGDKLAQFGEAGMLRLAGARREEDGMIHEGNKESIEAANDGILRDIRSWLDFRDSNGDASFYLRPVVWLQQRVGLDHSVMNPQSSKVHRHLMYPKSWETEIDPASDSQEAMLFKVAVAQGMGFAVDKKNLQAAVDHFDQLVQDPVMQAGMEAIRKDTLEQADQDAVAAAVKQGGENLWSFHMLLEMAKHAEGKPFTTNVMLEIDGVTNGPALTNLMLGTIGPWLGNKVGLIQQRVSQAYGINNHSQFKEAGGRDMYESLAHLVQKELNKAMTDSDRYQAIQDILYFTGSFSDPTGRNRVKTPLTSLKFGSGLDGTISNMVDEFISLYYEAVEKSADDNNFIAQQEILTRINRLLPANNQVEGIDQVLNRQQKNSIRHHFTEQVGEAVKTALETQFENFIERRKEIYAGSKALFEVYEKTRDFLTHQAVEEAIKLGDIRVREIDGKEQAIDDLTQEAYDEIDRKLGDILPVMHTALSKLSNSTDRTKGLMLAKQVKHEAEDSNVYRQKVQFSRPLKNNVTKGKRGKQQLSSWVRVRAEKLSWEEPGVRAVVLGIHATDSAIASRTYAKFDGLNIHDAIGFRLKDVFEGGKALNRNTFRVMTEYSLPLELLNSLQASHDALQTMLAGLPADQRTQLQSAINTINLGTPKKPIPYNQGLIDSYAGIAYRMEVDKLTFMAGLNTVSQYSLDGTEYTVTDSDRKIVNDRLTEAQGKLAQYGGHLAHREVLTEQEAAPNQTPWGMTGPARYNSDPHLAGLFENRDKITARELTQALKARIQSGGRTPELVQFETRLLDAAMRVVDPNMEIRMIRPGSKTIDGVEDLQTAFGFYHPDGWIGVKSPEFSSSLITTEMFLHELLHGATQQMLQRLDDGLETDPAAIEAQKRLKQLLTKARAYVQKEGLDSQFGPAVTNVSELISWGLTSARFQEEVLAKIEMDADQQRSVWAELKQSGFGAFINSLAGLLFKNRNNQFLETGLGSLVANSAVLLDHAGNQASQTRPKDGDTNNQPIRPMNPGQTAFSLSPQEVFDQLADDAAPANPARASYLKDILTNITDVVFQDGAFKERVQRETPFTAQDVFLEATQGSDTAFTSDIANTLNLTQQEHYVLESMELAMRNTLELNNATPIAREAHLMWQAMQKQGKEVMYGGDWNALSKDQRDYYEAAYNAIFGVTLNKNNRSIYLSKFLAAAAVYPPLAEAMSKQTLQKGDASLHGLTFKQRVDKLMKLAWSTLLRWLSKARTGDNYSDAAYKLVAQMVHLEKKRQRRLERAIKRGETGLEAKANKLAESIKEGVRKGAQADIFKKSKASAVRLTSNMVQLSMEGRVGAFMDALKKIRDGASGEKTGFWGQTWTELRGDDNILAELTQLLSNTKTLEQRRKRFNIEVANDILAAFEGDLSKEESEALTKVLVRSGAHILMDQHSMQDILDLVANEQIRKNRIQALIQQLPADHRGYYTTQAKALGTHMATGHVKTPLLMRNAYNIANKLGTSQRFEVNTKMAAAAEPVIDEIATLVAIDQQGAAATQKSGDYRTLAAEVMRRELGRVSESQNLNGVEFLLRSHKEMEREAHKSLFGGDKTQIVKGYTKDTYDPYIDVIVAPRSDWDRLKDAGYSRVDHELMRDDADPRNQDYALFTARNGGLGEHVTAILNNTDGQRQGTSMVDQINNKSVTVLQSIANNKRAALKGMMEGKGAGASNNALVPVLDTKGHVISWRYLMSEVSRDNVLGRNNDVGKVMGNIASSIIDKSQTPLVNKNAVDALKNIYDRNFVDNSEAFIEFGPNSTDPEIRERYKLLPKTTKDYIRDTWGRDTMMIRNDSYNILFGYRKASIGSVLDTDPEQRNMLQRLMVAAIGEVELRDDNGRVIKRITKKRGNRILQAENIWQEIVTMIKDILVIKSGLTLMGNESSNLTVLYLNGVPLTQIAKLKAIAYASTKEYIGHRREKEALERSLRLGHLQGQYLQEAQERILVLNEMMTANPVSELMDDGMYQTLVEDVSQDDDPYSYQSLLSKKLDQGTSWVPKPLKTVSKTLVMTHDSSLYKIMNDLTVMSDFTSRYVLNEHLKNRVTNQITADERRQRVRDAFVDYDVPTSKAMQYMNDMGLVWFSKYYMRIQHVILQMVKENPTRALQIWAMADWLYSLPDILDSTWISKDLGNMLGTGAFQIMDAPKEIMTYSGTVG